MAEPALWTPLFNRVKAAVPAAIDANIRQEISAVMGEFTTDTNLFVEEINFTTVAGVQDYTLPITVGSPVRLLLVWNPADETYRWPFSGVTMRVPGTIRLPRKPTEGGTVLRAAIAKSCTTPQMVGTPPVPTGYPEIDDWIVVRYTDTLYYGVMAYLQRQPAKPYTDQRVASANGALYTSGKSAARVANQQTNIYGGQAWAFPQGWSTVSRKGWT